MIHILAKKFQIQSYFFPREKLILNPRKKSTRTLQNRRKQIMARILEKIKQKYNIIKIKIIILDYSNTF